MQAIRRSRTSWSASSALAVLGVAWSGLAGAATIDADLEARLARDNGVQRFPVILRLAKQADVATLAQGLNGTPAGTRGGRLLESLRRFNTPLQAPVLQDLKARQAESVLPLLTVNAVAASVSAKDVRELAKRGDIESVRYDIGLLAPSRQWVGDPCRPERPTPRQRLPKSCFQTAAAQPTVEAARFDPRLPAGPAARAVGAAEAWMAGHTGQGVTVAVVDTGVDVRHPDLAGSFRGGAADWFDVHGEQARPVDRHGHGTQITGLVAAAGSSGQTIGVAPQSRWIAARIYNDRNVGRLSQLHRIMAWLLDPDGNPATADAPQIALNAWGLGDRPGACDKEFADDLALLRAAGIHMVFAAGNGGPNENSSVSPANNPGAFAVGALDGTGQPALFSSRGPSACDARAYPDAMAPGELLRTTDLSAGRLSPTTVATGSSHAAALVAGELALLLQARPQSTLAEREQALRPVVGDARPPLLRALGLTPASAERQP